LIPLYIYVALAVSRSAAATLLSLPALTGRRGNRSGSETPSRFSSWTCRPQSRSMRSHEPWKQTSLASTLMKVPRRRRCGARLSTSTWF